MPLAPEAVSCAVCGARVPLIARPDAVRDRRDRTARGTSADPAAVPPPGAGPAPVPFGPAVRRRTVEVPPPPVPSVGRRVLAQLADLGVLLVGAGAAAGAASVVGAPPLAAVVTTAVLVLVAQVVAEGVLGATAGAAALRLRTVSHGTGASPGPGRALVRQLVLAAGSVLPLAGTVLVAASAALDHGPDRRGWHDRASGTRVVDASTPRHARGPARERSSRVATPGSGAALPAASAAPGAVVPSPRPPAGGAVPPSVPTPVALGGDDGSSGGDGWGAADAAGAGDAQGAGDAHGAGEAWGTGAVWGPGGAWGATGAVDRGRGRVADGPSVPVAPGPAVPAPPVPEQVGPAPVASEPVPAALVPVPPVPAPPVPVPPVPVPPVPVPPVPVSALPGAYPGDGTDPRPPAPAAPSVLHDELVELEHTRVRDLAQLRRRSTTLALQFDTGPRVRVVGRGLAGRGPRAEDGADILHVVAVDDPSRSVSRVHLEFGPQPPEGPDDAAAVWVLDRGSTNGSVVVAPGGEAHVLPPGTRAVVGPGWTVRIGERVVRVEDA